MAKTKHKPFTLAEAQTVRNKLEIHQESFDLRQFRNGLQDKLVDVPNKAITSCASSDPNDIDKVIRAHFNATSDHSSQRLQSEKAAKREDGSKRAITQAEATASMK